MERHAHGGGRIQEAGSQPSQAAVAQSVIGNLLKDGYVHPILRHGLLLDKQKDHFLIHLNFGRQS